MTVESTQRASVAGVQPEPVASVLVAVYNAAPYLAGCLDSLCGQTLADIEIVCVDDASTDGSLDILRRYAARDRRIRLLHLDENGGPARARNAGLAVATGRYVTFLDSDDRLSPDALEKAAGVFAAHPQTGCVLFDLRYVEEDGSERPFDMPAFEVLSGRRAFELSLDWEIHGCYLAPKELFDRWPYDDTCRTYSDENTTRLHFINAREVRRCGGIYYYRMTPGSITHEVTLHSFDLLPANESMAAVLDTLDVDEAVRARYETIRWLNVIDRCQLYHCHARRFSAADRRKALRLLRHAWQTVRIGRVPLRIALKFGYWHAGAWPLFRLQEWIYFTLRGLAGRNSVKS